MCRKFSFTFFFLTKSTWEYELSSFHLVPQQSHTNLSVRTIHNNNYFMGQLDMFTQIIGHCCRLPWWQVSFSDKLFCCNNYLISWSLKLVEVCIAYCKFLYQFKIFLSIHLEEVDFYIQVLEINSCPRNLSKPVVIFSRLRIVGTS